MYTMPDSQNQEKSTLPVFFLEKENNFSTYDVCAAVSEVVGSERVTGAQKIRSLWRIYINTEEARITLLTEGLVIEGIRQNLLSQNPFTSNPRGDTEDTVKVTVRDIPLSYSNDEIKKFLENKSVKMTSDVKYAKARDKNGKLTEFLNGDRYVFAEKNTLLQKPLDRYSICGAFKCRIFHAGQSLKLSCTNCFASGHTRHNCRNQTACAVCKKPGHEAGQAECEKYEPQVDVCTFAGSDDPLSNFYMAEFEYRGIEVASAEHAYQYRKALSNGMPDHGKRILNAKNPREAKDLGRYVKCTREWEEENRTIMEEIVLEKFTQVTQAKKALLRTGESVLAEAVPGQLLWGTGLSKDATFNTTRDAWPGQNWLGNILCDVRQKLKRESKSPEPKAQATEVLDSLHRNRREARKGYDWRYKSDTRDKRKLSDNTKESQSPSRRPRVSGNGDRHRSPSIGARPSRSNYQYRSSSSDTSISRYFRTDNRPSGLESHNGEYGFN